MKLAGAVMGLDIGGYQASALPMFRHPVTAAISVCIGKSSWLRINSVRIESMSIRNGSVGGRCESRMGLTGQFRKKLQPWLILGESKRRD